MARSPIRSIPTLTFCLLACWCANTSQAQEPQVQVSITPDTLAIQPGKSFHLAITITPQSGWHIYWENPGDSGLPTTVTWQLPPGFSAGHLQFPIPRQFTLPGNIIAYGYEGPTTFLATITAPKDFDLSGDVPIAGTVAWLCCKEECVPGRKPFLIHLPIAQEAVHTNISLFKQAQTRMPGDTPWAAQQVANNPGITKTPDGEIVTLHLGLPALPCEMFPNPTPDLIVSEIITTPTPAGNDIQFKVHPLAGQPGSGGHTQHLPVLIVYTNLSAVRPSESITADDGRTGYYLNVDLSGLAPVGRP